MTKDNVEETKNEEKETHVENYPDADDKTVRAWN